MGSKALECELFTKESKMNSCVGLYWLLFGYICYILEEERTQAQAGENKKYIYSAAVRQQRHQTNDVRLCVVGLHGSSIVLKHDTWEEIGVLHGIGQEKGLEHVIS